MKLFGVREYNGPQSNQISNGILLRVDVHRLFDQHLIALDPECRTINVSDALQGGEYAQLHGLPAGLPVKASARPNFDALRERWIEFNRNRMVWE